MIQKSPPRVRWCSKELWELLLHTMDGETLMRLIQIVCFFRKDFGKTWSCPIILIPIEVNVPNAVEGLKTHLVRNHGTPFYLCIYFSFKAIVSRLTCMLSNLMITFIQFLHATLFCALMDHLVHLYFICWSNYKTGTIFSHHHFMDWFLFFLFNLCTHW